MIQMIDRRSTIYHACMNIVPLFKGVWPERFRGVGHGNNQRSKNNLLF